MKAIQQEEVESNLGTIYDIKNLLGMNLIEVNDFVIKKISYQKRA